MDVVMEKDEKYEVEVWRQERLQEAGLSQLIAYGLAIRTDVDYHQALDLFAKGCQPELLARIL